MPDDLRITTLTRCRNGHEFGPHRVHYSWHGCLCATARAGGHTDVKCTVCGDRQLDPPCSKEMSEQ